MVKCLNCEKITDNNKFCSKSCSASFNNKGVRRHGYKTYKPCLQCKTPTKNNKFCSKQCSSIHRTVLSEEDKKLDNRMRQSAYRAKQYRKMHPTACPNLIKEIYKNCPNGYEVDHIVPLSLGGWHHENNLQYLTIEENRRKSNRYIG